MKKNKIIFRQISCPESHYKRYELQEGDMVCPACGQLKSHYIYGITVDNEEIKEVK